MSEGRLRRAFRRLTADMSELAAEELRARAEQEGAIAIATAPLREKVAFFGTVQGTTLRPLAGVPAVEAELYDGTGSVYLVWLGRREIAGIRTGVTLRAEGRVGQSGQRRTIFNPVYTIVPRKAD
jgi:hypothetical protein